MTVMMTVFVVQC